MRLAALALCVLFLAAAGPIQWTDATITSGAACSTSGFWSSRTGANKGKVFSCEGTPTKSWVLVNDTGSGGGGAVAIEEGDAQETAAASVIDFADADFDVTVSPAGEANVSVAPALTRDSEVTSLISGTADLMVAIASDGTGIKSGLLEVATGSQTIFPAVALGTVNLGDEIKPFGFANLRELTLFEQGSSAMRFSFKVVDLGSNDYALRIGSEYAESFPFFLSIKGIEDTIDMKVALASGFDYASMTLGFGNNDYNTGYDARMVNEINNGKLRFDVRSVTPLTLFANGSVRMPGYDGCAMLSSDADGDLLCSSPPAETDPTVPLTSLGDYGNVCSDAVYASVRRSLDGETNECFVAADGQPSGSWAGAAVRLRGSGSLSCDYSTDGQILVNGSGLLEWCGDGSLERSARGDTNGAAMTGDSATAFFSVGTVEDARIDSALARDTEVVTIEKPAVQARNSSTVTMSAGIGTWADIAMDAEDVENNSSYITHNTVTNNARVTVLAAGTYRISYHAQCSNATNNTHIYNLRVYKNNTTAVPGSVRNGRASSSDRVPLSGTVIVTLAANDYVTLQYMNETDTTHVLAADATLIVEKL